MRKYSEENNLITQMGIQCHSSDMYRKAVVLIQQGIIGKVNTVRAWSPKIGGMTGRLLLAVIQYLTFNWNLWLETSPERPYKDGLFPLVTGGNYWIMVAEL